MGSVDKGHESRGCGVSPHPLQHRQAAASRYRRYCAPLPMPSSALPAFPGELRVITATSLALRMAQGPLKGGRCRLSGQTSSPSHTYRQPAKSYPPRGPEFTPGTKPVPWEGGVPKGPDGCHTPQGLPGADKPP